MVEKIGYKLGFNSTVFGILSKEMHLESGAILYLKEAPGLRVETEVAFILGDDCPGEIRNVEDLQRKVLHVALAIEAPNLGSDDPTSLSVSEILERNIFAHRFILGEKKKWNSVDVDGAVATIKKDGEILDRGEAKNVLGSPWLALLWLAKELPKYELALKKGDIVITGAMGKAIAPSPGAYVAESQDLGTLHFSVA